MPGPKVETLFIWGDEDNCMGKKKEDGAIMRKEKIGS
jgi:hypothetical protein